MFTIRTYRIPDSIVSSDQRFHVSIATQSNPTIVCELKFPSVPSTSSGARLHLLAIIARSSAGQRGGSFSLVSPIGMRGCPIPTGEHQQTYTRIYTRCIYVCKIQLGVPF